MSPFSKRYSQIYDILYAQKDYRRESAVIKQIIKRYNPDAERILDYGCGTGNYTGLLASMGYDVYGLDKNANMLSLGRKKLKGKRKIHLYSTARKDMIKKDSIDVCATLFDVISYMITDNEIVSFLRYIKKVLVDRGLLIFDFWYGPGIRNLKPEERRKLYNVGTSRILRRSTPSHDRKNHIVKATHRVSLLKKGKLPESFTDTHKMRYFFNKEMRSFLHQEGFRVLEFGTWADLRKPPTPDDWSALIVAVAN
ncbi:MAG: methyltransferase domain-containing protein [Candidatus Omnitrophica bacterium]|nr:methyltransferase domain-containing protein [Candidatus Omnitrophota bacterium]